MSNKKSYEKIKSGIHTYEPSNSTSHCFPCNAAKQINKHEMREKIRKQNIT
jgi:hypothetical protein